MLDITATNAVNIQTASTPKLKTWKTRKDAINAAVAELGPHARHEFEFVTQKCDGRWRWVATDPLTIKAPTGAEIKAMGGKRAFAQGSAPVRQSAATMVDSAQTTKCTTDVPASLAGHPDPARDATLAVHEERGRERAEAEDRAYPDANGLDIPDFLKRQDEPEQRKKIAKLVEQNDPKQRKIKNPPDAKKSKKRAEKREGNNIGFVARCAIMAGKTNAEALAEVMRVFPKCGSNAGCMSWYRNKLRKDGLLNKDNTPSAKGRTSPFAK